MCFQCQHGHSSLHILGSFYRFSLFLDFFSPTLKLLSRKGFDSNKFNQEEGQIRTNLCLIPLQNHYSTRQNFRLLAFFLFFLYSSAILIKMAHHLMMWLAYWEAGTFKIKCLCELRGLTKYIYIYIYMD